MTFMSSRWWILGSAGVGLALLVWTVWSVGLAQLATQLQAVRSVMPIVLMLAALRFALQAAGWRLAMTTDTRPTWREVFTAVVAGEAAGYLAWGTVSREPMKALLVSHRIPAKASLAAALVERVAYMSAATLLAIVSLGLIAVARGHLMWFGVGLLSLIGLGAVFAPRLARSLEARQPSIVAKVAALASAQELINVLEAWLVFGALGATSGISSILIFEGLSRLTNAASQIVPGKLGISEATSAAIAEALRIGSPQGLSLALARRVRSLTWTTVGMAILAYRASFTDLRLEAGVASGR
jgi:Lysylphosphatidylglycerol synthase TM region